MNFSCKYLNWVDVSRQVIQVLFPPVNARLSNLDACNRYEWQKDAVPWQELKKGEDPQIPQNVSSDHPSNPSWHVWRYWSWVAVRISTWSPLVFAARLWWLEALELVTTELPCAKLLPESFVAMGSACQEATYHLNVAAMAWYCDRNMAHPQVSACVE